ncbi:MAG: ATP-binding protein, partial [Candidatus Competibacterales bacterium]
PASPETPDLDGAWSTFLDGFGHDVPTDSQQLAKLLTHAIEQFAEEGDLALAVECTDHIIGVTGLAAPLRIGVCNKPPQRNALGSQIDALKKRVKAGDRVIVVRTSAFPASGKAFQAIEKLGALKVEISEADVGIIQAYGEFIRSREADEDTLSWRRKRRILHDLSTLQQLFPPKAEETSPPTPAVSSASASPPPAPTPSPRGESSPPGTLYIGRERSVAEGSVTLEAEALKRHSAFLGGSGSGKTTAVLNLVEQLLLQGISAVLIDRKGDLCSYAQEEAWQPRGDGRDAERQRLREAIDIALFTPGDPRGAHLPLPIAPPMDAQTSDFEREQAATQAAAALCNMMDVSKAKGAQFQAVLKQAILVLQGRPGDQGISLEAIIDLIALPDPALVEALGHLDANLKALKNDLATVQLSKGQLLAQGDPFDVAGLFGVGQRRPRLTIISTKFLADLNDTFFWLTQFLISVNRHFSANPSSHLQAVMLFDEADMYLPAVGKPSTKEPLEDLLKRARSMGLGLMLATQSPGDLDYKSRDQIATWLLGRIREENALKKIAPLVSGSKATLEQIANQTVGQFVFTQEGHHRPIQVNPSLIRAEQVDEAEILRLARG